MKASVVIPTYNRKDILAKVLVEFLKQRGTNENFELVVVDDGSSDGTKDLFSKLQNIAIEETKLRKNHKEIINEARIGNLNQILSSGDYLENPEIKYIRIEKSGRSVARNVGIEFSEGQLIIFSDDDIFVEKNYICKHIQAHHADDMLVIMGRVINTDDLNNPFSAKWKLRDINTAFLATGNASVLKEYIEKAGGFDENYKIYGWEDFDLGVHLSEMGLKSVKKPIYGYHYNPISDYADPVALYNKEKERGVTAVYFYVNHPLPWVKRFTLVKSISLPFIVNIFTKGMVQKYLKKNRVKLRGLKRLLFRYSAYFEGIREGKRIYE